MRLQHLPAGGLEELRCSGLEKKRRLTAAFQRLKGVHEQKGDVPFAQSDSDRTKGSSFDLKRGDEVRR